MLRVCRQLASVVQNVERSLLLLVTQATDLSLPSIKCCSVVFGVTLILLVINISSSSPAINKLRRLLPAISVTTCEMMVRRRRIGNAWPFATARSEARYQLRIAISAYPTCIRRPGQGFPSEYCHAVWSRKTRMAWLPGGKKISKICLFVLTEFTNVTDTQTDTQTPHDNIGRAYAQHRAAKRLYSMFCTAEANQ